MGKVILSCFLFVFSFAFNPAFSQENLKDGDIIFITNPSGQGKAIQMATGSEFTHVGIIFIEDGKPIVYHAVEPVSKNTFEEFKSMSADGTCKIRRLKDQSALDDEKIDAMKTEAIKMLGKHYDYAFSWGDKELYCSEFVWKLYRNHPGVEVGHLKPLKSYNLADPGVREAIERRYGKKVPLDEMMISPGDIYNSELLEDR